ncbi:max-binding protein MNT [Syngnathoides biaculeatus]|uniref:max-binding protein MNT n=1 Tax=Syngnathoides biaculeatus TaxID=300417 RepID=UPI002ADD7174|nr:max-binding protein MNT [Syngnathoides biaculeatus]
MSIETLLEAAKFLELQAQQQQIARGDEAKENLLDLDPLPEPRQTDVNKSKCRGHVNNVFKAEELITERPPAPVPPSLPPPAVPVAVIPIPVVKPNPAGSPSVPVALLSRPAAPPLASPKREPPSPQEQGVVAPPLSPQHKPDDLNHKLHTQNHHHHPTQLLAQTISANVQQQQTQQQQLLQRYPGSIVSPPHQAALSSQPLQPANGPSSRGSPPDDGRLLDQKKRPGGAGTREVHNKLEKNRRAHLKECFETLKKNIPNIDEKKTSNLSVLRSALRYIQTLKRKEKEYEHDMERLAREKIATQQHLEELKNELSQWMDVVEIERVLRQTAQPEEDQASTSTASEGEEVMEDEDEDDDVPARAPSPSPAAPQAHKADPLQQTAAHTLTVTGPASSFLARHASAPPAPPAAAGQPALHPTVIAHASVSHPSVIQAVNHVIQAGAPGQPPIGHITVHPVAHLSPHLPALYPQPVAVTQPALISHIAHTLGHVNGAAGQPSAAVVNKQTVVAHHPQLVGQTVLNPVTMVTMPSFPISTLKLA